MHFTPTLTVLSTILSAASTSLIPRQSQPDQCPSTTNSTTPTTNTTTTNTTNTTPIPLPALLTSFLPFSPTSPLPSDPHIQIRETSMLYPLLIDGKSFSLLNLVFHPNIIANLSLPPPSPAITGLPSLQAALQESVAGVDSHHNLGTQVIDYTGGCEANSVTYFHTSLLGKGDREGEVVYALGQYQDRWVKGEMGWRIRGRNLVYMSPFIGKASIVGG